MKYTITIPDRCICGTPRSRLTLFQVFIPCLNPHCRGQNVPIPLQNYVSNEKLLQDRYEKEKAKSKKVYGGLITALILCLLFGPQPTLLYLLQTDSSFAPLEVHFIDVGHGDAIFLRYGDLEIMIDTGPNTNEARHELNQIIASLNIIEIDYLILTHPHEDHIGNAKYLLEKLPIKWVFRSGFVLSEPTIPYNELNKWIEENPNDTMCVEGENISTWPQLTEYDIDFSFSFLYVNPNAGNIHDASIVSYLRYKNDEFLFLGDIERSGEELMLANLPNFNWQTIDYVKIAHHGSKTSTCETLLQAVAPMKAIISCRLGDPYHPHDETVVHLRDYNCPIYSTSYCGTISYPNEI